MSIFRLLAKQSHSRFEKGIIVQYRAGDTIEMTPHEAEFHAHQIELVTQTPGVSHATQAVPPAPKAGPRGPSTLEEVLALSWQKVVSLIEKADDLEDLEELVQAECDGKARKSILAAGATRITQLS